MEGNPLGQDPDDPLAIQSISRPHRNYRCVTGGRSVYQNRASMEPYGDPNAHDAPPDNPAVKAGLSKTARERESAHEYWIKHLHARGARCYHDPDGSKQLSVLYDSWAPRWMPDPKGPAPGASATMVCGVGCHDFSYQPRNVFCGGRLAPDDESANVGTLSFSITDLPIYDDLVDNFDTYRIDEIQLRFTSIRSPVLRRSPGVYVVVDRYDSNWSPEDMRISDKTIEVYNDQSLDLVFRPRLLHSGIFASAQKFWEDPDQWVDLTRPLLHYGLRIAVPRPEFSQGDPDYCDYSWDVTARYKVSLRVDSL